MPATRSNDLSQTAGLREALAVHASRLEGIERLLEKVNAHLEALDGRITLLLPDCAVHKQRLDDAQRHIEELRRQNGRHAVESRVLGGLASALAALAAAAYLSGGPRP